MEEWRHHTIIVIPASLKNGANNAAKKYKLDTGDVFTAPLFPTGSVSFATPYAYICCMHLPIWKRIRLETLVSSLNNQNVYIEDVDLVKEPRRPKEILTELNLIRQPPPGV